MSKVYCVFRGEYSDRELVAIFSTEEKARYYIGMERRFGGKWATYDFDIDPISYELDEAKNIETVYYRYRVYNGKREVCIAEDIYDWKKEDVFESSDKSKTGDEINLIVRVNYNVNEEVMKKAVYDKVAEYFAKKEL